MNMIDITWLSNKEIEYVKRKHKRRQFRIAYIREIQFQGIFTIEIAKELDEQRTTFIHLCDIRDFIEQMLYMDL